MARETAARNRKSDEVNIPSRLNVVLRGANHDGTNINKTLDGRIRAEYYGLYIDRVPNGDILELLESQIADFTGLLSAASEQQAGVLHDPYTWTIKQVVGHLIDVEKVFGYRAHRFACNDLRPILGMDQNDFVNGLDYESPRLSDLVVELKCSRRSNCYFLKRIPETAWSRTGTADGNVISVRAIAYILVGHVIHHLEIIKKRLA